MIASYQTSAVQPSFGLCFAATAPVLWPDAVLVGVRAFRISGSSAI
jgi:hypothetical protein